MRPMPYMVASPWILKEWVNEEETSECRVHVTQDFKKLADTLRTTKHMKQSWVCPTNSEEMEQDI